MIFTVMTCSVKYFKVIITVIVIAVFQVNRVMTVMALTTGCCYVAYDWPEEN